MSLVNLSEFSGPTDLSTIATALRAQAGDRGKLVLDGTVIADVLRGRLRTAFALSSGDDLEIAGVKPDDIPDPSGGALTISAGVTSLLSLKGVAVTLVFSTGTQRPIELVVNATMPPGWSFASSFPDLDLFPFNALDLVDVHFIFTSADARRPWPGATDPNDDVPLAAGLNLLAMAGFGGQSLIGALLGTLLDSGRYRFYGPFSPVPGQSLPVGALAAQISTGSFGIGVAPNALTLASPTIVASIQAATDLNPVQEIDLAISAIFNDVLTVTLSLPMQGSTIMIGAAPLPASPSIANLIGHLPGGANFMSYLPQEVSGLFAEVGLGGFEMVVDTQSGVSYVGLDIQTLKPWQVIEGVLRLDQLSLAIDIIEPGRPASWTTIQLQASANFLPKIFHDQNFEFTVIIARRDNWEVERITGAFYGSVTLADIVGGLLGNASSVPEALGYIAFSNFGVTASRPGPGQAYTYTLFAQIDTVFPIADQQLAASLAIVISKTPNSYAIELAGALAIGEEAFQINLDLGTEGAKLSATWARTGPALGFDEIARALGWSDAPALPTGLDLALEHAGFSYDFKQKRVILTATSAHYGQFVLVSDIDPATKKRRYLLDLGIPLNIKLSDLPVAGPQIPGALDLGVRQIEVSYASAPMKPEQVSGINVDLAALKAVPLGSPSFDQGMLFYANLQLGGTSEPLAMPRPPTPPPVPDGAPSDPGGSTSVSYFDIARQLGPFQLDRVGVGYANGLLSVAVDAGVTLGPIELDLMGVSVSSPLSKFEPVFGIDGLSLSFNRGPLNLAGAFLKVNETSGAAYYGEIAVTVASFSLTALGGYKPANKGNAGSFFIFANLKIPLGGPPYFFITGFAGGFGVNRRLELPTFTTLPGYLLLPANAPRQGATPSATVNALLPRIQSTFPDKDGAYWIAAGISFTSFEMIDSFALVTVSFGVDFQVGLLGSSAMSFPKGATAPVAYIEIDISASFTPASGRFGLIGMLTPAASVFGGLVRISGGFAFYIWYDGPNKGQFVVSIGGYHPAFNPPAYYPAVPRLAMEFGVGPLKVSGQAYFALTPSAMMAGLTLQATWESGPIKAWFVAGIDFLIAWAPFHYDAHAFVSIGCSVNLGLFTLSLHVGADLHVWGPDFGGQATIDLDICSFTIAFGAAARLPDPIGWTAFRDGFLPAPGKAPPPRVRTVNAFRAHPLLAAAPRMSADRAAAAEADTSTNILNGSVQRGLCGSRVDGFDWIVNANDFAIAVVSTLPANQAAWGADAAGEVAIALTPDAWSGAVVPSQAPNCLLMPATLEPFADTAVWNPALGLRPMKLTAVTSTLALVVQRHTDRDGKGVYSETVVDLALEPILLDVATALYANTSHGGDANEAPTVPKALVGLRVVPIPRQPKTVSNVPLATLLFQTGYDTGFRYQDAEPDPRYAATLSVPSRDTLDVTITGPAAPSAAIRNTNYVFAAVDAPFIAGQRNRTLAALTAAGVATRASGQVDLKLFASQTMLTDWPGVGTLGGVPATRAQSLSPGAPA